MSRTDLASRHLPALDGLRAVSITIVLLSHLGLRQVVPGGFGVTVFFFISGLLITRQLLAEFGQAGRIDLPAFAMRRMLRLYPALVVMVTIGGVAFAVLGGRVVPSQIAVALLYGTNYLLLAGGLPSGVPHDYHPFSILWSLAVEEHFYLVFPVFLLLTARLRMFGAALVGALVVLTAWRLHVVDACTLHQALCLDADAADRVAYGSDTRVDGILYGAVLATVSHRPLWRKWLGSPVAHGLAAILLLTGLMVRDPTFRLSFIYTVQGLGMFVGVGWLLGATSAEPLRRALSWRPVTLVGQWSYSLYLWHWVVMVCAAACLPGGLAELTGEGRPGFHLPVFLPPLLAASFVLACLSFYLVERPTLRLRRRFGSIAGGCMPNRRMPPVSRAGLDKKCSFLKKRTKKLFLNFALGGRWVR